MRDLILGLVLGSLALLGGCANLAPAPTGLPEFRLAPAAYGQSLELAQRLTVHETPVESDSPTPSARSLDTQLQLDTQALRLVAMAMGQRVLSLHWDGLALQVQRHPLLPAAVDPVRVLRDIALVFAPLDALRAALPPGWRLEEAGAERRLLQGDELRLTVRFLQAREQVEIDNLRERYRLRLDSLELQP